MERLAVLVLVALLTACSAGSPGYVETPEEHTPSERFASSFFKRLLGLDAATTQQMCREVYAIGSDNYAEMFATQYDVEWAGPYDERGAAMAFSRWCE